MRPLNLKYLRKGKIDFREFQVNIARKCFNKNSLVVVPTGLGKTIIALFISAYTQENSPADSKVIILAPTRPLINQHYESYLRLMNLDESDFSILTGQVKPEKRIKEFLKSKILFYTPQTLRNDLINQRYSLFNTCIIIFDECHRAQGDYAYCQIADRYIEQNPDGIILGLTASPGSSREKISILCKNLHIPSNNIYLRTRKDVDVEKYIQPMKIITLGVDMTEIMEVIHGVLRKMTQERLDYLHSLGFFDANESSLKNISRKYLIELNRELLSIINSNEDASMAYKALSINAQGLRLLHMINLVEAQGMDALILYIESMKKQAKKPNPSKALSLLANDFNLNKIYYKLKEYEETKPQLLVHPKFNACRDIILKEINNNPDARILVFSKLRNSVSAITKNLKAYKAIKAKRFVGQATKSENDKGLSQKKQIEILNKFKAGEYNVLVSTNVAEEGLDIAECDLVIFYDTVASEIRLIQRKGRTARVRQGKVVILYCKGTSDEIYLHISLNRLKKMQKALRSKNNGRKILNEDSKIKRVVKTSKNKDITDFFSYKVEINRNFPLFFGIRKFLKDSKIGFQISSSKYHIHIGNKLGVHIFPAREIIEMEKNNLIESWVNDFKSKFNLAIVVTEYLDFESQFGGDLNLVRHGISKISGKYDIPIMFIDKQEELQIILRGFFDKIFN